MSISITGLISGIIGTSTGGLMAFFINKISNKFLSFILEFSAGLMIAVVCFKLIPEAFEFGSYTITFLGIFSGIAIIFYLENIIRKMQFIKRGSKDSTLLQAGILTAIGIALHNFPEGFAVGSGFEASLSLGFTLMIVILIHDVPEGIAMAVPMRAGGFSKLRAFFLTVLSGVPMGFGAFFGAILGEVSKGFISACLGFAGGAMLYIVCAELIPESKRLYRGRFSSMGNILGIICGIIVSTI